MTIQNMPDLWRDFMSLHILLVATAASVGLFLSMLQRVWWRARVCGAILSICFVLNIMLKDVTEYIVYGDRFPFLEIVEQVPRWITSGLILLLTVVVYHSVKRCLAWGRVNVSAISIKEAMDQLPTGIAIFDENGVCLLVNYRMNEICTWLTGHTVQNGQELYRIVREREMEIPVKDRRYVFQCTRHDETGETLYELRADDMTELYERTEELRRGNRELEELNRQLTRYGMTIDDTVHRQEILQAKVDIHDEMNRLLLSTANAAVNGASPEEINRIRRTWQNNALLLCMEADEDPARSNTISDLETLASLIGITIVWDGDLRMERGETRKLFEHVVREAMTNAVKHAAAKRLYVKLRSDGENMIVTCTNDGAPFTGTLHPGGGLTNLRGMLTREGGSLTVNSQPEFTLTAEIPMGGNTYAI